MKKEIWAIIPARSGSKGIKNKNILHIKGRPLIFYTIKSAIASKMFTKVIVLTDSLKYAKIAKKFGAEIPFLRPRKISQDNSTDNDLYNYFFNFFKNKKIKVPEYFAHLSPTVPLRSKNVIKKGINFCCR